MDCKIEVVNAPDHVKKIRDALAINGGYCPCRLEKNEDTRCMCKEFVEQDYEGVCHCGLYRKTLL